MEEEEFGNSGLAKKFGTNATNLKAALNSGGTIAQQQSDYVRRQLAGSKDPNTQSLLGELGNKKYTVRQRSLLMGALPGVEQPDTAAVSPQPQQAKPAVVDPAQKMYASNVGSGHFFDKDLASNLFGAGRVNSFTDSLLKAAPDSASSIVEAPRTLASARKPIKRVDNSYSYGSDF